jgi:hypothetical protein
MNDFNRETYELWIDRLRRIAAIGMVSGFVGLLIGQGSPIGVLGAIMAGTCNLLGIALCFEYLIRVWLFRPERNLPWYQFSIAGMLIATTCVAAVCAFLKILGPIGIVWIVIGLIIFACILDTWYRNMK